MKEALQKYTQTSWLDLVNFTSLQELEVGQEPYALQDGLMINQSSPQACHVNHSARLASNSERMTNGIYCHTSLNWSKPVSQALFLANRSIKPLLTQRERSQKLTDALSQELKNLLTVGHPIYKQTWKPKATMSGFIFWAHTAQVHSIKDNAFIGLPTPTISNDGSNATSMAVLDRGHGINLAGAAELMAGFPTPIASDNRDRGKWDDPAIQRRMAIGKSIELSMLATAMTGERITGYNTSRANDAEKRGTPAIDSRNGLVCDAQLASWPTPNCADENASRSSNPQDYSTRWMQRDNHGSQLAHTAQALAAWATPKAQNANTAHPHGQGGLGLQEQDQLAPWATPNTMDVLPCRSPQAMYKQARNGGRTGRTFPGNLREQVDPIMQQAYLDAKTDAECGITQTGYGAETENTDQSTETSNLSFGQLNPALSRWLMGYPVEWDIAAIQAHMKILEAKKSTSTTRKKPENRA